MASSLPSIWRPSRLQDEEQIECDLPLSRCVVSKGIHSMSCLTLFPYIPHQVAAKLHVSLPAQKYQLPFLITPAFPSVSPSETEMFLRTHPNYCLSQNPTYDSGEQEGLCPDPGGLGLPPRRITKTGIIFPLEILGLGNQKTQAIKSQNTNTWAWRVGVTK